MHKEILSNGLTLLVVRRASKVATIMVTVKTGSNNETKKEKGVSHFVEHMLFEGTKARTSIEITKAIEGIGGDIGAFTTNEETCFYVRVLPKHLNIAVEILFDIIKNPAFNRREIEKERSVILNEINLKNDEPRFLQWELFLRNLFRDMPTSFSISGTRESVQKVTREMLVDYHKKYYAPNNMILTYVGANVDKRQIVRKFSCLKRQRTAECCWKTKEIGRQEKFVCREISQSYLVFGYRTQPRVHKDSYTLDVIRAVLGRGMSGLLVHEIRTIKGLAYEVGCHHEANKFYGFFSIYLSTDKKNITKCNRIIRKHMTRLKTRPVSKNELTEAKNFLEGEFTIEMEDNQKFATALAIWEYSGLGDDLNEYVHNIKKVKREDILRIAKKYFRNNYCLTIVRQK